LVLPFKKGIQICTTSVFRVEDGGGTFLWNDSKFFLTFMGPCIVNVC
jgi:hypothetical protein